MNNAMQYEQESSRFFDAYDAVPRDGPAVFVATTHPDDGEALRGQWISIDRSTQDVRRDIVDAVGVAAVAAGTWRVIDQVHLGHHMLPEDLRPDELRAEAIRQAAIARHPSSFRPGLELRPVDAIGAEGTS